MNKNILLISIFCIGFFLRFFNLTTVPPALYQDETSIGYNAYSILETQKDEYGKTFPVYFKSFGDQKLPAYIYLTSLSMSVFGVNEFAVRFPSALVGSLSVIILYFIVKLVTKRRDVAIVSAILLAINPWSLHFSRAAFEVNVGLFFVLLGSLCFVSGIVKKRFWLISISVILFAASLYSYNVTRLLSPLIFLSLVLIHFKNFKTIGKTKISVLVFIAFLVLSPFIYTILTPAGASSAFGALITSTDIQAKLVEMRGYYLYMPEIFTKLFFNKFVYLGWIYLANIAGIFSFPFFFVSGSPHGNQGIGNIGLFYLFEFPLIVFSLYEILKNKWREYSLFLVWAVICLLVLALSKEVPHATRGFFLVIPMTVFSALGLVLTFEYMKKIKPHLLRSIGFIALGGIMLYSLVFYFSSYYVRFPSLYASSWRTADKELAIYISENSDKYDKIIFDDSAGFVYSSLLFYNKYSPDNFQATVVREDDDSEGFSKVLSFGKYSFRSVDWSKDVDQKNTLIVTSVKNLPTGVNTSKIFYYPSRPVAISVKEQLQQYPVQEAAYVLVEGK